MHYMSSPVTAEAECCSDLSPQLTYYFSAHAPGILVGSKSAQPPASLLFTLHWWTNKIMLFNLHRRMWHWDPVCSIMYFEDCKRLPSHNAYNKIERLLRFAIRVHHEVGKPQCVKSKHEFITSFDSRLWLNYYHVDVEHWRTNVRVAFYKPGPSWHQEMS